MKQHGNSNENLEDHHLYEIKDSLDGDVVKYGISFEKLEKDGSSPRANIQVDLFNKVVGFVRFFANVLLIGIPGRIKAKEIEDEYIRDYEKKNGRKPRGNV